MSTTIPAMRGKFGTTEYYVVTMPASQLEQTLRLPKELKGWEDFTLEERFQREVNFKRVKEHIAPYLANDPDRFFGAFIVAIINNDDEDPFEPLSDVIKNVPKRYQNEIDEFGFLVLSGKEVFVPLDGQHRLTAIKFAITGKDEKNKPIPNLKPLQELGKDICSCIMIKFDKDKARKIFNKVNRYAKPTSKADNLITADDDIVAVITRAIVEKRNMSRLVKLSNTLNKSAVEFTTLNTLYEATGAVLESPLGVNHKIDRTKLPDSNIRRIMEKAAVDFWNEFFEKITVFHTPLIELGEAGDQKRMDFREEYVLGKPIIQLALVEAVVRLSSVSNEEGINMPLDQIIAKINEVDWTVDNPDWQRVMLNGEKVIVGKQACKFASRFLAYLLGEPLEPVELTTLSDQYAVLFDEPGTALPKPLSAR